VQPLLQWKNIKYYTFSVCVCSLVIQHAMRMRHVVIRGLSGSTILFLIISQTARFSGEKVITQKMSVLTFPTRFVRNISHSGKN